MHPERDGNHKEVLTFRDGVVLQRKGHVGWRRHGQNLGDSSSLLAADIPSIIRAQP
jgi:hypothetical protein